MLRLCVVLFILLVTSSFAAGITPVNQGTVHAVSRSRYTRAHSLGENYKFEPRDGWEHVHVTNMQYKYARSNISRSDTQSSALEKRGRKKGSKSSRKHGKRPGSNGKGGLGVGGTIKHVLGQAWNGLKAIGGPEPVIITWYECLTSTCVNIANDYTGTRGMICSIRAVGAMVLGTRPYATHNVTTPPRRLT
jgi:hypothetical protein